MHLLGLNGLEKEELALKTGSEHLRGTGEGMGGSRILGM